MEKYILNLAGEYRVCAELLRHEMFATVTIGNLKGADIHIVTKERKVIVIEVKTTDSNRFVTGFYQKYKSADAAHPDFWVLCKLCAGGDEFFVLSHSEMARVQAVRNGFSGDFHWDAVRDKCAKGVDNVIRQDVLAFAGAWNKIKVAAGA